VKERVNGDECYGSTLYTCIKIKWWNPLKLFLKGTWKSNRGGEFYQNALYALWKYQNYTINVH
jgi:hypothetical protein